MECRQISAALLVRFSRIFEQGERFERPAGTERSSTKLSQELNEALARVRFERADILSPFPLVRNESLPFIGRHPSEPVAILLPQSKREVIARWDGHVVVMTNLRFVPAY